MKEDFVKLNMNRNSQNFLTELETDYSTIFGDKRNFSIYQKIQIQQDMTAGKQKRQFNIDSQSQGRCINLAIGRG